MHVVIIRSHNANIELSSHKILNLISPFLKTMGKEIATVQLIEIRMKVGPLNVLDAQKDSLKTDQRRMCSESIGIRIVI